MTTVMELIANDDIEVVMDRHWSRHYWDFGNIRLEVDVRDDPGQRDAGIPPGRAYDFAFKNVAGHHLEWADDDDDAEVRFVESMLVVECGENASDLRSM